MSLNEFKDMAQNNIPSSSDIALGKALSGYFKNVSEGRKSAAIQKLVNGLKDQDAGRFIREEAGVLIGKGRYVEAYQKAVLLSHVASPEEKEFLAALQVPLGRLVEDRAGRRRGEAEAGEKIRELRQRLATDPLTGVRSREGVFQAIEHQKAQMIRYNKGVHNKGVHNKGVHGSGKAPYSFAVVYIDLNGFKAINDTFGHPKGDDILVNVAGRLNRGLERRTDTFGRLGGDEFVFVLPYNSAANPKERFDEAFVRQKIHRAFEGLIVWDEDGEKPYTVTPSIGVAFFDDKEKISGLGATDILARADRAMYRDKRKNKEAIQDAALEKARMMPPEDRDYAPRVAPQTTSDPAPQFPEGPAQP